MCGSSVIPIKFIQWGVTKHTAFQRLVPYIGQVFIVYNFMGKNLSYIQYAWGRKTVCQEPIHISNNNTAIKSQQKVLNILSCLF
jgi:hypothetical protein